MSADNQKANGGGEPTSNTDLRNFEGPLRGGRYLFTTNSGSLSPAMLTITDRRIIETVGTYDVLWRQLFPPIFNGSQPSGGDSHQGRIELPATMTAKQLGDLLDAIDAKFAESQQ